MIPFTGRLFLFALFSICSAALWKESQQFHLLTEGGVTGTTPSWGTWADGNFAKYDELDSNAATYIWGSPAPGAGNTYETNRLCMPLSAPTVDPTGPVLGLAVELDVWAEFPDQNMKVWVTQSQLSSDNAGGRDYHSDNLCLDPVPPAPFEPNCLLLRQTGQPPMPVLPGMMTTLNIGAPDNSANTVLPSDGRTLEFCIRFKVSCPGAPPAPEPCNNPAITISLFRAKVILFTLEPVVVTSAMIDSNAIFVVRGQNMESMAGSPLQPPKVVVTQENRSATIQAAEVSCGTAGFPPSQNCGTDIGPWHQNPLFLGAIKTGKFSVLLRHVSGNETLPIAMANEPELLCGNDIVDGASQGEDCDGGPCCLPTCNGFAPQAQVCREAQGDCDAAETCPGNSDTCPPDGVHPPSVPCTCPGETTQYECTGNSADCPCPTLPPTSAPSAAPSSAPTQSPSAAPSSAPTSACSLAASVDYTPVVGSTAELIWDDFVSKEVDGPKPLLSDQCCISLSQDPTLIMDEIVGRKCIFESEFNLVSADTGCPHCHTQGIDYQKHSVSLDLWTISFEAQLDNLCEMFDYWYTVSEIKAKFGAPSEEVYITSVACTPMDPSRKRAITFGDTLSIVVGVSSEATANAIADDAATSSGVLGGTLSKFGTAPMILAESVTMSSSASSQTVTVLPPPSPKATTTAPDGSKSGTDGTARTTAAFASSAGGGGTTDTTRVPQGATDASPTPPSEFDRIGDGEGPLALAPEEIGGVGAAGAVLVIGFVVLGVMFARRRGQARQRQSRARGDGGETGGGGGGGGRAMDAVAEAATYDNPPSGIVSAGSSAPLKSPRSKKPRTPRSKGSDATAGGTIDLSAKYIIHDDDISKGKPIGEGSFGMVYAGEWRDTQVAIKEVKTAAPSLKKALLEEAEGMMRLRPHANIVTFYGICTEPFAIVTEFCKMGSLDDLLYHEKPERRVKFTIDEKNSLALDIARGINHLHREKLVHRDLAARNVLVDERKVGKIADFGMARATEDEAQGKNYTNTAVGPIRWMAPEQMDRQQYSYQSDVWSFGVTLVELYNARPPWEGLSNMRVASNVIAGKHLDAPPSAPEAIKEVILKCFSFEPADRPSMHAALGMMQGKSLIKKRSSSRRKKKSNQSEENLMEATYDSPPTAASVNASMASTATATTTAMADSAAAAGGDDNYDEVPKTLAK